MRAVFPGSPRSCPARRLRPPHGVTRAQRVGARCPRADFVEGIHGVLFEALVGLQAQGRLPSIESLVAVLDNDEVVPDVRCGSTCHS